MEAALRGVSGVYYIAPVYPHDESQKVGRSFVEAAANAGVRRFVFISSVKVNGDLKQSGADYVAALHVAAGEPTRVAHSPQKIPVGFVRE